MRTIRFYCVLIAACAILTGAICATLYASPNGKCCGENYDVCSGCFSMGIFYLNVETNSAWKCQTAPAEYFECPAEELRECWSKSGMVPVFSDANCTNQSGSTTNPKLNIAQCPTTLGGCD